MSSVCDLLYTHLPNTKEPIIKRPGVDLFKHPVVTAWHKYFMASWSSSKPVALLLPCSSVKPYSKSPTHRLVYSLLKNYNLDGVVQVYSVSEPMLLVPRELEECYPFNSYDYPPSSMSKEEKDEFISELVPPLIKVSRLHKVLVGVLPKHHYNIVKRASELAGVKVELYPYGKLAFKTISEVVKSLREVYARYAEE